MDEKFYIYNKFIGNFELVMGEKVTIEHLPNFDFFVHLNNIQLNNKESFCHAGNDENCFSAERVLDESLKGAWKGTKIGAYLTGVLLLLVGVTVYNDDPEMKDRDHIVRYCELVGDSIICAFCPCVYGFIIGALGGARHAYVTLPTC